MKAAFTAVCVWHEPTVCGVGQVNVTAGAAVTVNVELHDFGASQSLVAVQVTVIEPPQAFGATGVAGFVVTTLPQPPPD